MDKMKTKSTEYVRVKGTRAPEEGESSSPAIDSRGLHGREGDAAGAHAVQPATTGGDDHGDVSSGYSPGGGSTDPAGTDAAVDSEPDNDDADSAARAMSQQLRRSLDEEEWDQVQNPPSQLPPS